MTGKKQNKAQGFRVFGADIRVGDKLYVPGDAIEVSEDSETMLLEILLGKCILTEAEYKKRTAPPKGKK